MAATRIDIFGQWITFFFVLSAFLLYLPYVKRFVAKRDSPDAKHYLQHRFRRIFPGYLFIFLVANFVLQAVYVRNPLASMTDGTPGAFGGIPGTGMITDPLELLAEFSLTQTFFPATMQTGINPAWSLTTEFTFYLILPIIGYVLFRFGRNSRHRYLVLALPPMMLWIGGIAVNSLVRYLQIEAGLTGLDTYWGANWVAVLSRSFFALADGFGAGMLAAVIFVAFSNGLLLSSWSTRKVMWLLFGISAVLWLGTAVIFMTEGHFVQTPAGVAAAATTLFITFPGSRGEWSRIGAIIDWRPLKYLGVISMSIYLWHYPIIIFVARFVPTRPSSLELLGIFASVTFITVILASFSYRYVELPGMEGRIPFIRARKAKAAVS